MKSFPCRWCWRGLQQNLVIFLAEQVETSNMGVSGATFGHQMLVFWFWEMEVVQKPNINPYQSWLLSPHSGWNFHAFSLVSWTLSRWQLQFFRPGIFSSSQENAGDLALAAILAGPPWAASAAVPVAAVLLAALERLEKVNATGMVALQYLRFEDERLADLPLSTLRKLKELVEEAFSVSEKNRMTPGISVQLEWAC